MKIEDPLNTIRTWKLTDSQLERRRQERRILHGNETGLIELSRQNEERMSPATQVVRQFRGTMQTHVFNPVGGHGYQEPMSDQYEDGDETRMYPSPYDGGQLPSLPSLPELPGSQRPENGFDGDQTVMLQSAIISPLDNGEDSGHTTVQVFDESMLKKFE